MTSEPASAAGMCVAPGDDVRNDAAFPAGKTDGNADLSEQLDLRRDNSWTQKIEEISTPELAEVFAINALRRGGRTPESQIRAGGASRVAEVRRRYAVMKGAATRGVSPPALGRGSAH